MIVIGDLHIKRKEPFLSSIRSFFEWLLQNYKDEIIVLLGDLYDSSSPHGNVEDFTAHYLKQFKEVHIITGNHDYSAKQGLSLLQLRQHDNIFVYNDVTEVKIEDSKCLLLPFKYSGIKEEYEQLTGKYDFVFSHITHPKEAFGDEGIELKVGADYYIYGHVHTQKDYGNHIILGVPIPTRHLEHNQVCRIANISKKKVDIIETPVYFTYEDVEYGEMPVNKNNILNIKNAPSLISVLYKYKEFYIRDEGVTIALEDQDEEMEDIIDIDVDSFKATFVEYSKEKHISKEIVDCCLEFL